MKKALYIFIITGLFILFLELFFRLIGYAPVAFNQSVVSIPEIPYSADSLGITLKKGTYKITINNKVAYTATHDETGKRITSKMPIPATDKIWILGCSFAYGVGVNDEESYPFLLQNHFKELEVQNFAIPGTATIQSYYKLKEQLAKGHRPKIVMLSYATFHEERNQLTRGFESNLYDGMRLHKGLELSNYFYPRCKIVNNKIKIENIDIIKDFTPIPWVEKAAIATFINQTWNAFEDKKTNGFPVSKYLILDFQKLAKQYNFKLIIADVAYSKRSEEIENFCYKRKINYVSISPDFSLGNYTLAPYDYHPNKLAHKVYAGKLYEYITKIK
jgi:hypothetical protein